jgi:hypothetical protein
MASHRTDGVIQLARPAEQLDILKAPEHCQRT